MTEDEFDNGYHLLQSEKAVFFTALTLEDLEVGAIHTHLNLSEGVILANWIRGAELCFDRTACEKS
jgi:hypothetical protein